MDTIDIWDGTEEDMEDLCHVCVPSHKRDDPDWVKGVGEKTKWAIEMLHQWGSFAKLAHQGERPVGMIQFRPIPQDRVVHIDCVYVPPAECLRKGIATRLLSSLMEDVKKPMTWFDNKRPLGLVTKTFPGEGPGQYSAREFFTRKGFKRIGEDADHLYYPLKAGFVYRPAEKKEAKYIPQDEDRGRALIVCGPNGCPVTDPYVLKRMEKYIREIDPEVSIRWMDSSEEPEELRKRNVGVGACVVNARLIETFVLDKESFQKEVKESLADG